MATQDKVIKIGKWDYTEAELQRQFEQVEAEEKGAEVAEARAVAVHFNPLLRNVTIGLRSGVLITIPVDIMEGLAGAGSQDLMDVVVEANGYTLRWHALDQDFAVPGLVSGLVGTKAWMAELARRGGKATSPAKARASRVNGRKGGRPKQALRARDGRTAEGRKRLSSH